MYESEFGDVTDPSGLVKIGEYGRFDTKVKASGLSITKDALAEVERCATEGLPLEALYQSLADASLTPGLDEFASWAKMKGGRQFIVSDGWDVVAGYLAIKLGAERYAGSHPVFEGGRFTGEVIKLEQKKPIIDGFLRLMGLTYADSIGIDDASSVLAEFALPIAFCPTNPKLRENHNIIVVEEPEYKHVQEIAQEWLFYHEMAERTPTKKL